MLYLIIAATALLAAPADEDIFTLLPGNGVPEGWELPEAPQLFPREALFSHINGGAELYLQYGFDRLALADYEKGSLEVRVEIYKMNDAEAAAGIFAENSKGVEKSDKFGKACTLDQYQIIFHRDRYYVSVTCYEPSEELQAAMETLAAAVDEAIVNESK
ncbi:MAG TPA: DUF6599 family protein [Acidobacteriota bacterium]|nr:DUF6599 family protein [Acidobacteriota bacterium]